MNCPGCGADNLEGSKFCRSCGGRLTLDGVDYSSASRDNHTPRRDISDTERWWTIGSAWGLYSMRALIGLSFTTFLTFVGAVYCVYKALVDSDQLFILPAVVLFLVAGGALYLVFKLLRDIYSEPDDGSEMLTSEEAAETSYELTNLPPRR